MACERPRRIVNRRYKDMTRREIYEYSQLVYGLMWPPDYILDVPCSYCHSCQKSYNNQYRLRLLFECRKPCDSGCINLFVTLTFNDEFLEKFASDTNRAVRLFLDRMRKRYGKQVRHWFIGEYGTLKGRPHYHGILFNCPREIGNSAYGHHPGQNLELESVWKYGFVFVGYVNDSTCSYITKYLTKSINGDKVRPRVISSKGIGLSYLDSDEARLHRLSVDSYQPFVVLNGFRQAMPRYLYNKIFTDIDRQNMVLQRYLDPPQVFEWQGVRYYDRSAYQSARLSTYRYNVSLGLTPSQPLPTHPICHHYGDVLDAFNYDFINSVYR